MTCSMRARNWRWARRAMGSTVVLRARGPGLVVDRDESPVQEQWSGGECVVEHASQYRQQGPDGAVHHGLASLEDRREGAFGQVGP